MSLHPLQLKLQLGQIQSSRLKVNESHAHGFVHIGFQYHIGEKAVFFHGIVLLTFLSLEVRHVQNSWYAYKPHDYPPKSHEYHH